MHYILAFFILTASLFPQLKEFSIREEKAPPNPPVFVNNTEEAVLIIYSVIEGISFESNTDGLVDVKSEQEKYTLLIRPERQYIRVKCRGYLEERISVPKLNPREVLYFQIGTKGADLALIPVNIVTSPPGAQIYINGEFKGTAQNQLLPAGIHKLRLVLEKYKTVEADILVSQTNTLFNFTLSQVDQAGVEIRTVPEQAEIFINGASRGLTNRSFFLFPGVYALRLVKNGYLEINQEVLVKEDTVNSFTYNLTKNAAYLTVSVTPSAAELRLNGQPYTPGVIELIPALYQIEVSLSGYLPVRDTVQLSLGARSSKNYTLNKNVGFLTASFTPPDAEIYLNKERIQLQSGVPRELGPGQYKIELKKPGYDEQSDIFEIELGKTLTKTYELRQQKGSLQISVQPLDVIVQLYQNGIKKYEWRGLKLQKDIPVGSYQLTCSYDGYETVTKNINITENKTLTEEVTLKAASLVVKQPVQETYSSPPPSGNSKYFSFLVPGLGQMINGRWTGYLFTAATVVLGVYYFKNASDHQDNISALNTALTNYKAVPGIATKATAENAKVKADDTYAMGQNLVYAFAGLYVISVIDMHLLMGTQRMTLMPGVDSFRNPKLDLKLRF